MVRFSIITICLNTENEIKETILSVLKQDCNDFEYLIKDGVSKDRTVEIAESFAAEFEKRGISYRVISCPDSGIYDAMNQGTREAQGEWVLYMNVGDRFADKTVLSRVENSGVLESADIVYGDVILSNQGFYFYKKASALQELRYEMPFCHQSTLTRRELLEKVPYSLRYRICSDHLFFLQMYTEGKRFRYIPIAISIYSMNGISSNAKLRGQEKLKILEEMSICDEEAIQREKRKLKKIDWQIFWHEHLWKYVPAQLRQARRKRMKEKMGGRTEEAFFCRVRAEEEFVRLV